MRYMGTKVVYVSEYIAVHVIARELPYHTATTVFVL
jgi:hypothetical protein